MTPQAPDDPEHGQENALHRDDGRTLYSRADLQEAYQLSESTLQNLWTDRENNGHPDAEIIDGVMHWDDAEWLPGTGSSSGSAPPPSPRTLRTSPVTRKRKLARPGPPASAATPTPPPFPTT